MAGTRSIVIVGGCGHVGLPLGLILAARANCRVKLLDIDPKKVETVNARRMPFLEKGAERLMQVVVGKNLEATLDPKCLETADVVILVVGTPVDNHLNPTVNGLYGSIDKVLDHLKDGTLLVLRSTVYPGVTRLIEERVKAKNRNVAVAFCPERIAEGNAIEELAELPQIVAANDPEAQAKARELFLTITSKIIELTPLEAELAKLFTNSWRYLNFAVSNQFYMLAESYGLDFYRIYDAVTRDYPRMRSFARAGFAAGPCLLKDTLQLSAFASNNFFLGHAAMLINEGLPNFVVNQLRSHNLSSRRVAILGMAFKGDSDDVRDSLSYKLKKLLEVEALEVLCTDPHVTDPALVPLEIAIERADIIVLGTPHSAYKHLNIPATKILFDVWGFLPLPEAVTDKWPPAEVPTEQAQVTAVS
jgi:UDP-N-acetyl-D-mannosaminuronic acid dehydrogenase